MFEPAVQADEPGLPEWADWPPGPRLADALARLDLAHADDTLLIEAMRGYDRLTSWATAGQYATIDQLARRRAHDDPDPRLGRTPDDWTVDEIGCALRLSRLAAGHRLGVALDLRRLPDTYTALATGAIDPAKTRAITDAVHPLDEPTAHTVEQRVLPRAGAQTLGQLRASLARAVLSADPAGADRRHQQATTQRRVELHDQPDGMAALWALLPAPDALRAYHTLDTAARNAPPDDPRGMDARRADTLVDLITRPARHSTHTEPPPDDDMPLDDDPPPDDDPPLDDDPPPTYQPPTYQPDADPDEPPAEPPADDQPPAAPPAEPRPADGAERTSRTGPTRNGGPTRTGGRTGGSGTQLWVIVPVGTLLGLTDEPGELAGYGPIPPTLTRQLAADATWRRLLTDPPSGALLDVGRRTYRPPTALTEHVTLRDGTCRFPTCRQPARRCDLDHTIRYPDGPTSHDNLGALCRPHHRLKHETRWTVQQTEHGTFTWTSPTGHTYTRHPDGPTTPPDQPTPPD